MIAKKVVVNEEIDYRAKPNNGDPDWVWELGSGNCGAFLPFWKLVAINGPFSAKRNKGAKIDEISMPLSNDDFGITNGLVKVTNNSENSCEDEDGNEYRVEVFYKKDEKNNPGMVEPNWFYYWKQFINVQSVGTTLIYDNTISGYAYTDPFSRKIVVSQLASEKNDETNHRGLHTFYETVEHENHHMVLWDAWWPNGYVSSEDLDNDFYPDDWEDNDPIAQFWQFNSGDPSDHYQNSNESGYLYEEFVCRQIEHNLIETLFDNKDWSYDSTNINQGKQW